MRLIHDEYKTSNSFSSLPFDIVKRDYILRMDIKKAINKVHPKCECEILKKLKLIEGCYRCQLFRAFEIKELKL